MIPAGPHPLMMCGDGDPLDEFGKIARSVRLRRSAGANLSRTFPGPGSLTTWTFRVCCKRADLVNYLRIFGIGNDSNSVSQHSMTFYGGSGEVQFILTNAGAAAVAAVETNAFKRDPAAHCDLQFTWDTTNPTASERLRVYCDGVRQTVKSTTYPAQNTAGLINTAALHRIGALSASTSYWFDGYLSHVAFIDGQALEPSAFGQTHPRTGQWRPKSKAAIRAAVAAGGGARNGWGANGFFLPFDDVTSLTTLGYDRSQSDTDTTGNNWTANNISLTAGATYDSMLDTPTNNFPTMNPVESGANRDYFEGALGVQPNSSTLGAWCAFGATQLIRSGKWYWEVEVRHPIGDSYGFTGVITPDQLITGNHGGASLTGSRQYAKSISSVSPGTGLWSNGVSSASGTYPDGFAYASPYPVLQVAFDADNGELYFGRDGVWYAGSNPAARTAPAFSGIPAGHYLPYADLYSASARRTATVFNFGQRPFTYSPPAGFKALCTKNLPINPAGPMKSSSAFVAVTDTGANIVSALAAAAPWSDWIRIIKRRDASEGWRWIFSDDPTNYLDTSTPNAKAALPAFAGSSYVGYALKVSAANGVATGTFVHANGVASVISDGLSNARKMVILHRESAGGGNFFVYHPDLTAGKLMYLDQKTAETTDASIGSVSASGFTAAAALPSGTYRYISIAETADFIKLWRSTGNGVSGDGRFVTTGFPPAFDLYKRADVAGPWSMHDSVRSANVNVIELQLNSTQAENGGTDPDPAAIDLVSSGTKVRTTMTDTNAAYSNASGGSYVGFSIAAFPFRYSNAR